MPFQLGSTFTGRLRPYLQLLDQSGMACQGQTLQLICLIVREMRRLIILIIGVNVKKVSSSSMMIRKAKLWPLYQVSLSGLVLYFQVDFCKHKIGKKCLPWTNTPTYLVSHKDRTFKNISIEGNNVKPFWSSVKNDYWLHFVHYRPFKMTEISSVSLKP
jgi:hypothetical protein